MSAVGLAALALSGIFALTVLFAFPGVRTLLGQILLGTFLLILALTLVSLLVIAITGFNPMPLIRQGAVLATGHKLVNMFDIMPAGYRVQSVQYENTDVDEEEEWVVFYQFDLVDGRSPYGGAIYDLDRGNPPVLFPYQLVPPDRDYLSDGWARLEREQIVPPGELDPLKELLVYGHSGGIDTELTIFRYVENTLEWQPPTDDPRRYRVIGFFRGDGGVSFHADSKAVTVLNHAGRERSQLAVRTVYRLDEAHETYMSPTDPEKLAAPASSEVIFAFDMPGDILQTPYPEKIVLAFYEMIDKETPPIAPDKFLVDEALVKYNNKELGYFGLQNASVAKDVDKDSVQVTELSYVPEVEEFNTAQTILGDQPQKIVVSVAFDAKVHGAYISTSVPIQWVLRVVDGTWKISYRL